MFTYSSRMAIEIYAKLPRVVGKHSSEHQNNMPTQHLDLIYYFWVEIYLLNTNKRWRLIYQHQCNQWIQPKQSILIDWKIYYFNLEFSCLFLLP